MLIAHIWLFSLYFSSFSSQILTTMKMKEVTDLCQNDVRFRALRSAGERKQALAEYQVCVGSGVRGAGEGEGEWYCDGMNEFDLNVVMY